MNKKTWSNNKVTYWLIIICAGYILANILELFIYFIGEWSRYYFIGLCLCYVGISTLIRYKKRRKI